jgi:integrase
MLKSMLRLKENVDISNYGKLQLYLKRETEGYETKKSKILSQDDVPKFLTQAPGDTFLLIKVALIFGLYSACRSEELRKLNVGDIEDTGFILVVTLHYTTTKKKRYDGNEKNE